ncbi:MAG TPA: PepSY domain-containing protein [Blastocatellia bacterium]|nr:PepSY domain-containing protein [Blastocatellia bacterium]
MNSGTIKIWYLVHKWTSLISTVFLLLLCVTGLLLIFHHEIDHALGYSIEPPARPETSQRASLDAIVAAAKARRPGDFVQFVVTDPDEPEAWFVRLGKTADGPNLSAFYTYDARTGDYLHEYPLDQGVMNVMLRLHVDMFAGLKGTLFLGAMGLLLVASLVSGTVVYGPFMRRLRFGTVRKGRAARLKWMDLHNLLGIATLVWLLVVGLTGIINTLAIPIFGRWQSTHLAEMVAPYRNSPPLDDAGSPERAVAAARAAEPGMELSFMAFPGNDFASPHHFVAFMRGTTPWASKLLKPVLIDAGTNQVVEKRDLPWYVQGLLISQPLHFGDYGGWPLKCLWAVLDVLAIIVLGSGLYLWLKKRHVSFESWLRSMQAEELEPAALSTAPSRGGSV